MTENAVIVHSDFSLSDCHFSLICLESPYCQGLAIGPWDQLVSPNCKVPKFSDARKLCCNLPKIQIKRPNLRVFPQRDTNGTASSEDPDQTAPLEVLLFFIQFNVPFKIISLISRPAKLRWVETKVPRENHLTHLQAELGLSHMWPVRDSNLHQTQW